MTLYEAYFKARDDANRDGLTLLVSCADFGEFWGFYFEHNPPKEDLNGGCYVTVNKKTGAIGYFIPTMDFDLWDRKRPIPIDQFAERAKVA